MRVNFVAAALLATFAAGAATAQMPPAGFYVRGDVGGAFGQDVTFSDTDPSAPNHDLGKATLPAHVNDSVMFGGGVGYRFSPLWRADLTVDDIPSLRGGGTADQVPPTTGSAPFS
jgi:opacity protein-like surface antigen